MTIAEGSQMELIRDPDDHDRLAQIARAKADASPDPDLARRLREAAVKHERAARRQRQQAIKVGRAPT
ncbi:MAG: hypothetical protein ABIT09_07755 [Croceibacterium sp.]